MRPTLLHSLQALLERTYRMDTGIADVAPFLIGDAGFRQLYDRPGVQARAQRAGAAAGGGARVLVRETDGAVAACIYYPDALIRCLEDHPPARGLTDGNMDAFATFVEELDHFLLLAERVRLRRPVSLLELEMHANVTKYLVCALFLAARRGRGPRSPLGERDRVWLLWHLFEKVSFAEPDPQVQSRYQAASRFARRFLSGLDAAPTAAARLERLRLFHDASHEKKLAALA